ncbi:MAG: GNAT family N-acetyltransferase [Bacteroidota bacterium]
MASRRRTKVIQNFRNGKIADESHIPAILRHTNPCTISIIKTDSEFDALECAWNKLLEESEATVFQTFEWQRTWWKFHNQHRRLHCVVFKDDDHTIGIAPIFLEDITFLGIRVATWIQFIGVEISDYLQIIIAAGYETTVINSFAQYLSSIRSSWDVFDLRDISQGSIALETLPVVFKRFGLPARVLAKAETTHVALPETWETFQAQLSRNKRHHLRTEEKKLAKYFQSKVEIIKHADDDVFQAVASFIDIHNHRWESLGYRSAFHCPNHRAFHFEVAEKFAARGWLRLLFLNVNGTRAATSFNFNFRDKIYVYLCHAYGTRELMSLSPGFLLRCRSIEQGIAEGMKTFDYLRGAETYKSQEFPNERKINYLIRAISPSEWGLSHFLVFTFGEYLMRIGKRLAQEYHYAKRYLLEHR